MPQLSAIYIFLIYLWTWLTIYLIMQKTKNVSINKNPTIMPHTSLKTPSPLLPWT